MSDHKVEDIKDISADRFAQEKQPVCSLHPKKSAEIFCEACQDCICILCATSTHEKCEGKKLLDDVVTQIQTEMNGQIKVLNDMDTSLGIEVGIDTIFQ